MTDAGFLDGNVVAGPRGEAFAVNVTAAQTTCSGYGRRGEVPTCAPTTAGPAS